MTDQSEKDRQREAFEAWWNSRFVMPFVETDFEIWQAALSHAAQAKQEWQPIETAPKDGFHVLLYLPEIMHVGFWGGYNWHTTSSGCPPIHPTHWMPLPDAPKDTK